MSDGSKFDCTICTRKNSADDMVQCDGCHKWSHFSCAGVDASVSGIIWLCKTCTELNNTLQGVSIPAENKDCRRPLPAPKNQMENTTRKSGSIISVASTSRSKRMLKLQLLQLEEQKKLDEDWKRKEQEFLNKKYELLTREAEDDDSVDANSTLMDRTAMWVNNAMNFPTNNPTIPNLCQIEQSPPTVLSVESCAPQPCVAPRVLSEREIAARQVLAKELPIFSGKPEEWPLFISSYENTTKMCGFSQEENLCRLQRAIKGRAMEAVGSRLLLPSTVPEVIATLRMLYGRPEYIVQTLIKKIREDPPPRAERLDTIINFALSVRSLHTTMEASGLTNHLNNPLLLQELLEKLPASIRLNWAMSNGGDKQNLTGFSEWLFKMAEAACVVTPCALIGDRKQSNLHAHVEPAVQQTRLKPSPECYFCSGEHKLTSCKKFLDFSLTSKWEFIRSRNICEICLGHQKRFKCRVPRACGFNGCSSKHHSLLHGEVKESTQPECFEHQEAIGKDTLFNIVPVVLYGNGQSLHTFAFLDNGSSLTLVEESIAKSLGLVGYAKPLSLKWTADTVRLEQDSKVVSLDISGRGQGFKHMKYQLGNVRTVKKLSLPIQSIDCELLQNKYPHLSDVPIESYKNANCGILIGLNNQNLLLTQKLREGSWCDPVAIKTRLGWCVSGSNINGTEINGFYHTYEACQCNKDLHEKVRQHFILEDQGIEKMQIKTAEEVRALNILEATVERDGNAFCTGLLWKYDDVFLPESYQMALKRLKCLEKKTTVDNSMLELVNNQINNLLSKGYARKLNRTEMYDQHPHRIWYLPTFIVRNHNKPGKIRLVWDAAATTQGVSLNSMLLKGPDELRLLTDVLYGFRTNHVAIAGDIEEMFHQVRVRKEDQDSQRFLWRFGDVNREPDEFAMNVLTFGTTCSPSIAQFVKNKNAKEYANDFPRAAEAIIEHHYVDDLLDSVATVEEAVQLAKDVKYIHSKAGFNIRNWLSNSKEVLQALEQPESIGKAFQQHPTEAQNTTKVLGLWWNTNEDILTFSLRFTAAQEDVLKGLRIPTKRELLRVLMTIFDPLGFLSFYLVRLKILLQEVWKFSINWDDVIPLNLQHKWETWRCLLSRVEEVKIQRCYLPQGFNKEEADVQLHIFVDASEDAMAAVAYFRFQYENFVSCVIICAKTKVAPLKPLSIPRLELQAALMGSRMAATIQRSHKLNISKRFLWTDSRNVLCWLQEDAKKFKQFVMFRVGEILEHTNQDEWRWVPTKQNVADKATKWQKIPVFEPNDQWFQGPEYLYQAEDMWPKINKNFEQQPDELRPQFVLITDLAEEGLNIDFGRFSRWKHLYRSIAMLIRSIDVFRRKKAGIMKDVLSAENFRGLKR